MRSSAFVFALICTCANAQDLSSYFDDAGGEVGVEEGGTSESFYSYKDEGEQTSEEMNVGPLADGDDDAAYDLEEGGFDSYAMAGAGSSSYGSASYLGTDEDEGPVYDDFNDVNPGQFVPSPDFEVVEAPSCDDDDGCNSIPTLNVGPAFTYGKAKSEEVFMPKAKIAGLGFGAAAVIVVAAVALVGVLRRRSQVPQRVTNDLLPFNMV
jgi:hypothetical protein